MTAGPDVPIDLAQAAAMCSCCVKIFRRHVDAGEVKFIWIGKRRKFLRADIEAFKLARRTVCPSIGEVKRGGFTSGPKVVDFVAALERRINLSPSALKREPA